MLRTLSDFKHAHPLFYKSRCQPLTIFRHLSDDRCPTHSPELTLPPPEFDLAKALKSDHTPGQMNTFEPDSSSPDLNSKDHPKIKLKIIKRDDSLKYSLLFPGQGAQFVGMGRETLNAPGVKDIFDRASQILDFDLLDMCLNGPANMLDKTRYCQAAVVVCSLAAVEQLYTRIPEALESCISTAGFSVGEITALIFSGAISFDEGIRLIKVRSEAMQYCSELQPSGMITIFYGAKNNVSLGLQAAKKWTEEKHGIEKPVCQVANYLYAGAKVIAGHEEALRFLENNYEDFGIRGVKRLPVSGAFHTSLMGPAVPVFQETLNVCNVMDPRIPVYSNIKNLVYTKRGLVIKYLPKQMVKPVAWEQTMNNMFRYEVSEFLPNIVECGPGKALSGILFKINGKAGRRTTRVQV